ncbi:hypothetical protein BR93DRAFT_511043 [Coniochaeta sp. PMI_546]|nr:hypothetical protein BR93DRAFT_511043 [Coniochaeta sp. PMI_546]
MPDCLTDQESRTHSHKHHIEAGRKHISARWNWSGWSRFSSSTQSVAQGRGLCSRCCAIGPSRHRVPWAVRPAESHLFPFKLNVPILLAAPPHLTTAHSMVLARGPRHFSLVFSLSESGNIDPDSQEPGVDPVRGFDIGDLPRPAQASEKRLDSSSCTLWPLFIK